MATLVLGSRPPELEVLIVAWLGLRDGEYHPLERSRLEMGPVELAERLDWP